MKTKNIWFAMVLGTVLTFVFTACSENDEPYNPDNYQIQVLGEGVDSDIDVKTDNAGNSTILTYTSWIEVSKSERSQTEVAATRSSMYGGEVINIELSNTFYFNVGVVGVQNFEMRKKPLINIDYVKIVENDVGNYTTVTDSAVIWSVDYGGFIIPCHLEYQVASYKGGYPAVTMPYHKIQAVNVLGEPVIKDLGYQNIKFDSKTISLCFTKEFRLSVSVSCNNTTYAGNIVVTLCKPVSGDYITASRFVSDGLRKEHDGYYSSITVNQTLSNDSNLDKTYDEYLIVGAERISDDSPMRTSNKLNISIMDAEYVAKDTVLGVGSDYFSSYVHESVFTVRFVDFDVVYKFTTTAPVYNDGFTRHEMPWIKVKNVKHKGDLVIETDNKPDHEFGGVKCYRYEIALTIEAEYEGTDHSSFKEEMVYTRVIFVPAG
ncbi:MAG: hypothetical protein LBP56_08585 [Odoribacteraceae bacterium]|jgi:hypothetical protein|nr:hypothetical protein [Odoribacteraceae bacterium]